MTVIKAIHLTSHHDVLDNRIFHKECRSLAAAGFEVLLAAQHDHDETRDGVRILAVPRYRNRLERVTVTAARVTWRALRERPTIVHFHDPELIPWGLLLRLLGKRVVYDVHEDFTQAVTVRSWLPDWIRPFMTSAIRLLDGIAGKVFAIVIAERYYARRFPQATPVLNYAALDDYAKISRIERNPAGLEHIRLLYTGSITNSRGAAHHLRLLDHLPESAELRLVGHCRGQEAATLEARAARDPRLTLATSETWMAYSRIVEAYGEAWTAGLALFPDTPHYREKELTKFFEYMAAGLPIICSDFPVWRTIVEGGQVGLCVDPEDPAAAAAAVRWLAANPAAARSMGERGRQLVRERYNWQSQAETLVELYRRLAG